MSGVKKMTLSCSWKIITIGEHEMRYDHELEILKLREWCAIALVELRYQYLYEKEQMAEDFTYLHLEIHNQLKRISKKVHDGFHLRNS